jgi:hypothetical protein
MSPREIVAMATRLAIDAGASPHLIHERMAQLEQVLVLEMDEEDRPELCADCGIRDEPCDYHMSPRHKMEREAEDRI